jgi:DNA-binding transcriptional MocR family regulator
MTSSWIPNLEGAGGPKYLAIADAIAKAIVTGALAPGDKLPPQRNLAYDLGVTLGTVTRAYSEARLRGLVGGEVGRGTYVQTGEAKSPDGFITIAPLRTGEINFAHATGLPGRPGQKLAETLAQMVAMPDLHELANYQFETGLRRHREAGARWVNRAGAQADADTIAIVNGAQHGILVTLMAVAKPGDTVLAEALSYPGFIQTAQQLNIKLEPVAMDEEGIIPEALVEAQRRTSARVLYCMPGVHNPTAAKMSPERKQRLAETLRALDMVAIEDDVWSGIADNWPPPLASFAPERTYYITSLSKAMAGGLRIGYVTATQERIARVRSMVRLTGWLAAPVMAEIASRWIDDGTGEELARWQRDTIAERYAIADEYLAHLDPVYHPSGHYVWFHLPEPWRAADFQAEAEARGVLLLTGEAFAVGRAPAPHAVRLGIGKPDTVDDVRRGLDILSEILRAGPGSGPSGI